MVYATGSDQELIYALLQKDSYDFKKALDSLSLTVVKESISPVYTIDLLEYAETGVMYVKPSLAGKKSSDSKNNKGNVYIAKTITSQQEFGGNIKFYIEDNVAYNNLLVNSVVTRHNITTAILCITELVSKERMNQHEKNNFHNIMFINYIMRKWMYECIAATWK